MDDFDQDLKEILEEEKKNIKKNGREQKGNIIIVDNKETNEIKNDKNKETINKNDKNKEPIVKETIIKDKEPIINNKEAIIKNEKVDLLKLVDESLEKHKLKKLSQLLNVAPGTITRWKELKDVPKNYEFDLLKILSKKIDYSKYDSKTKDQFFTPDTTAQNCYNTFLKELKKYGDKEDDYIYIEPSAGDGSFIKTLPKNKYLAFDIEPRNDNIQEQDYLTWQPPKLKNGNYKNKYIVIGNPPFGLRGHLALQFINHSYDFADYVVFILPQLFESDGKGVPRKRVKGYNLIYSEKIESKFYEPNKKEVDINTIFQIWSKYHKNDEYVLTDIVNENMTVYSLSDGGTPSSTRNKDMLDKCDIYIPSTCFGKENMKCYDKFLDLPGKKGYGLVFHKNKNELIKKALETKWSEIAFLSTNSAYNLRSSQIYSLFK